MCRRMTCITLLLVLVACEHSRELKEVPRATLVLTNGSRIDVVQLPEGSQSSMNVPNGADARGVEAQDVAHVRIDGAPPFVADIRELKVVESDNQEGRVYIVPSPDRKTRILLSDCRNRADFYAECELRVLAGDDEVLKTRTLSSWGLPVWMDGRTFFFIGSSGALFRADCASRTIVQLESRDISLCAYSPARDGLLTTGRGGISLLDASTGSTKLWLVRGGAWTRVGDGAVISPDDRYLVYSRKRLLSETYDCYLRELASGGESLIVSGLGFSSGAWLRRE